MSRLVTGLHPKRMAGTLTTGCLGEFDQHCRLVGFPSERPIQSRRLEGLYPDLISHKECNLPTWVSTQRGKKGRLKSFLFAAPPGNSALGLHSQDLRGHLVHPLLQLSPTASAPLQAHDDSGGTKESGGLRVSTLRGNQLGVANTSLNISSSQ